MTEPTLIARFPSLRGPIAWRPLGTFPTAIERVDGLLARDAALWVKRDDRAGTLYGGNKVRKLEFLLADAQRRGKKRLITLGAWGSHHVLATAIYGRRAGFEVDAIVVPQPLRPDVLEHLLVDAAVGARLLPAASYAAVPAAIAAARARPGGYWIPAGGSSPVGTLGWVSAGLEIVEQIERRACPKIDAIYVALGSAGTVAGLWLGLALGGWQGRLVAVRVVGRALVNRGVVRRLALRTAHLLAARGVDVAPFGDPPALHVEHAAFGPGYAHATPEGEAAISVAARAGIALEPTYTGKCFAALLADAAAGRLDGQHVLFVDTFSSVDLAPLHPADPAAVIATLPPSLRKLFDRG